MRPVWIKVGGIYAFWSLEIESGVHFYLKVADSLLLTNCCEIGHNLKAEANNLYNLKKGPKKFYVFSNVMSKDLPNANFLILKTSD